MRYSRSAPGLAAIRATEIEAEAWLDELCDCCPELYRCDLEPSDGTVTHALRFWRFCRRIMYAANDSHNRLILCWWRGYGKWPNAY